MALENNSEFGRDLSVTFPDATSLRARIIECGFEDSYWCQDLLVQWDDMGAIDKRRYIDTVSKLEYRYPTMSNANDRQVAWHEELRRLDERRKAGKKRTDEFLATERLSKKKRFVYKHVVLWLFLIAVITWAVYDFACNILGVAVCL
jgi:hypothetical protein